MAVNGPVSTARLPGRPTTKPCQLGNTLCSFIPWQRKWDQSDDHVGRTVKHGHTGAEYDAYLIKIGDGDQFSSGFVDVNPNSKIPALLDTTTETPTRVFESGAILLYLAEKFDALLPKDPAKRTECLSWLFWQMGSAPYLGGGFGHFYAYAPFKIEYCIDRFTMEVKRQLDVLDRHLNDNEYMAGDEYSIADIAIWSWYGSLVMNRSYDAAEFLEAESYKNVLRWAKQIDKREAVQRGRKVTVLGVIWIASCMNVMMPAILSSRHRTRLRQSEPQ